MKLGPGCGLSEGPIISYLQCYMLPDAICHIEYVDVATLSQRLETCIGHTRAVYHKDVPEIGAVSANILKSCVTQLGVSCKVRFISFNPLPFTCDAQQTQFAQ